MTHSLEKSPLCFIFLLSESHNIYGWLIFLFFWKFGTWCSVILGLLILSQIRVWFPFYPFSGLSFFYYIVFDHPRLHFFFSFLSTSLYHYYIPPNLQFTWKNERKKLQKEKSKKCNYFVYFHHYHLFVLPLGSVSVARVPGRTGFRFISILYIFIIPLGLIGLLFEMSNY